jgi:uncharacterized protein YbjT (DUF2867 family)
VGTLDRMILVTGATGTVGSFVVRLLAERGAEFRAMSRRPSSVASGVYGSFDDPASLRAAADGVDTLFLVSPGGPATPAHDRAMLSAVADSGLRKVVKLSAIDIGPVADWHRPGESALHEFTWTVLRPTTFASNTLYWADLIRSGSPIPNPTGDGLQGVVDPRDLAEVAVEALLTDDHDGRVLTLTGPSLISVPGQAEVLSAVLERPVSTVDLSIADLRANLLAAGSAPPYADGVAAGSELVKAGRNAIVTSDVSQILHRAPRDFATWVRDHRTAFA